jgi:hypothetical protein
MRGRSSAQRLNTCSEIRRSPEPPLPRRAVLPTRGDGIRDDITSKCAPSGRFPAAANGEDL